MKQSTYFISLAFATIVSTSAFANEGIEVTGKGAVNAIPDKFSFTVRIEKRCKLASKCKAYIDNKSKMVVNALRSGGVADKHIDSSALRMFPVFPPRKNYNAIVETRIDPKNRAYIKPDLEKEALEKPLYFDVGRTFSVSIDTLDKYDKLLDDLVKIGVTHLSTLNASFASPEKLYDQALSAAIKDAKLKATAIAKQLGVNLGNVTMFRESGYRAPVHYSMARMSESDASFKSQASEKSVDAQVTVIYEIKP